MRPGTRKEGYLLWDRKELKYFCGHSCHKNAAYHCKRFINRERRRVGHRIEQAALIDTDQ